LTFLAPCGGVLVRLLWRGPMAKALPPKIDIELTAMAGRAAVPFLRKHLAAACTFLPKNQLRQVSVVLVGDVRMAGLHAKSHNDPTPTDVLTYELESDDRGRVSEGEIIICVPEARRRVGRDTMGVHRELLLYAIHGMLHLCGLDDRTKKGFELMHRKEDEILTAVGVGAVFAPASSSMRAGERVVRR